MNGEEYYKTSLCCITIHNGIKYSSVSGWIMILSSSTPRISTTIENSYPPLDYREDVIEFGFLDRMPENTEEPGDGKIGLSGFSTFFG